MLISNNGTIDQDQIRPHLAWDNFLEGGGLKGQNTWNDLNDKYPSEYQTDDTCVSLIEYHGTLKVMGSFDKIWSLCEVQSVIEMKTV